MLALRPLLIVAGTALPLLLGGMSTSASGQVVTGYGVYGPWGAYYDPYYGSPYGYSPFYDPYSAYVLPPLVLPAETIYGPGAVRRFIGLDPPLGSVPAVASPTPVVPAGVVVDDAPRRSNAQRRARAWHFIQIGDDYFSQQKYAEALNRYRDAMQTAPDVADAHYRYALAAVAVGRYDDAAEHLKSGLAILPTWPQAGFKLQQLYGDQQLARKAHLEALAQQAAARGGDPDLLFLLGAHLLLNGEPERAAVFLRRARQLTAGQSEHLDALLGMLDQQPAGNVAPHDEQLPAERNRPGEVMKDLRHF